MPRAAIVETLMTQLVTECRDAYANLRASEQDAAWRRVLLGRVLMKAREQLPKRGTPTHGWGAYLEAVEIDQATADRYMKLAEASLSLTERDKDKVPTYADLGIDRRESPQIESVPPPRDDDAPAEVLDHAPANDERPQVKVEVDRNTWCTPKWLAEALGSWDVDPCSNERSHIIASRNLRLDRGEDGLVMADRFEGKTRAFINPPYGRGQVIQWVRAYAHVRFCFLLKFDPSTEWFGELMEHTGVVMIPRGERVEFEPPPGVPPEQAVGVQFPHALFYARPSDVSKEIKDACFPGWFLKK